MLRLQILTERRNHKLTPSQNYAHLGLTSRLNRQSGGRENHSSSRPRDASTLGNSLTVHPTGSSIPSVRSAKLNKSTRTDHDRHARGSSNPDAQGPALAEARIERDPNTGAILRIVEASLAPETMNTNNHNSQHRKSLTAAERTLQLSGRRPLNSSYSAARGPNNHDPTLSGTYDDDDPPNPDDDADFDSDASSFDGFADTHAADGYVGSAALPTTTNNNTDVISALSTAALAARAARPKTKRKQGPHEREWCRRLVERWGNDVECMWRDTGINVMQLSRGVVRRRVETFLEAGG